MTIDDSHEDILDFRKAVPMLRSFDEMQKITKFGMWKGCCATFFV